MKRPLQYIVGAGALGALFIVDAMPVQAQMIEEILVTARKRTESAQDVPVVIQAFDAAAINRYAASNLEEISELASQVVINPGSSGNGGSVIIRGVGAPTLDPGIENSVTINIDGVQIDRGHVVRQAFFDMGSVQVLKGPQALFYGKNSPAGVIALESARPSYTESETRFQLGYELEAREIMGEAVISRPITENFLRAWPTAAPAWMAS
jgi:iron complex outermembrane receptor protein